MKLRNIFSKIELDEHTNTVLLDGERLPATLAKHSIWIPSDHMKFPFQHNGHFIEFRDVELGQHWYKVDRGTWASEKDAKRNSFFNIVEEYFMFEILNEKGFSPDMDGFFFIEELIL
jgi:hypothetical protein